MSDIAGAMAEKVVIAAMLLEDFAVQKASVLDAEDFVDRHGRAAFNTIMGMRNAGKTINFVTVCETMAAANTLDMPYMTACARATPTAANVDVYVEILRSARQRRQFTSGMMAAVKAAGSGEDYIGRAQDVIEGVKNLTKSSIESVKNKALPAVLNIGKPQGRLHTGFDALDFYLRGLHAGDLIIIAGQSSMGKTTFALNVALNVAKADKVMYFSLEMSEEDLIQRAAMSISGINEYEYQQDVAAACALQEAAEKLSEYHLYIDETAAVTAEHIMSACYEVKPALVVVDYLQIMRMPKADTRDRQVAEVTGRMKALAKEIKCPVILLSQLNRGYVQRRSKRPVMADLRDSGAIEQDADVVLFPYRPSANGESDDPNEAVIIVEKNRRGATGDVDVMCDLPHFLFSDKQDPNCPFV